MRLASERPKPQPRFFVVKPGLNTLLKCFLGIPLPVSVTSSSVPVETAESVSVMLPPCGMASTAFLQRFSITHSKSGSFTRTGKGCAAVRAVMVTLWGVRRAI